MACAAVVHLFSKLVRRTCESREAALLLIGCFIQVRIRPPKHVLIASKLLI
jgi:hypothetical protein